VWAMEGRLVRLLVVDDSPTQAEELKLILEAEGFEVETAPDGERGLERIRASRFDLVVSDILMPGVSGYDLCRHVKSDPATRDVPVILLTTLSDPLDVIQGLECGADNFLTKPCSPENLVRRVRHMLENKRLRAEGRLKVGVEIVFLGRTFAITSGKEQVLDLLISTFEDIVRKHRELQAATASLEAANHELEAFSYSVSHDLRAPLRAVDGFSQLLLQDCSERLDETGRGHLERIRTGVRRMTELIDDLLELARVSRADLREEPVDISDLARMVGATLQLQEPSRRVELSLQPGLSGRGDANLLRILIENLLANAWKFTSKCEQPKVEVGAAEAAGGTTFYVRDNGAGFDMQYAQKLFAPFQRLHPESEFPGTGVGLATVRRIVHRHGGRVWAEGSPGRGATFYFTLPSARTEGNA